MVVGITPCQQRRSSHHVESLGVDEAAAVLATCRGIGRGLVEKLLARNNKVIATTRDAKNATGLQQLAAEHPALTVTELDTSSSSSITSWAASLMQQLPHVDVSWSFFYVV